MTVLYLPAQAARAVGLVVALARRFAHPAQRQRRHGKGEHMTADTPPVPATTTRLAGRPAVPRAVDTLKQLAAERGVCIRPVAFRPHRAAGRPLRTR